MIFFDNASTTRPFDEVLVCMEETYKTAYFNPSALYNKALAARNLMEESREAIAGQLGADKDELFFTSCATEANNWVFYSGFKYKKGNIVVSAGEHASIYESAMRLKSKGIDVRFAKLLSDGTVDLEDLARVIDEETSLVSVIHCSNETGAINNIKEVAQITRSRAKRAVLHSDGVQAFCKIKTDLKALGVDLYTISAHKIAGPKGCGALYINKRLSMAPLIVGGGQEGSLRSGTENIPAIAGFAQAARCFAQLYSKEKIREIHDYIYANLTHDAWVHHGSRTANSGFILSLSHKGIRAEILQHMLSDQGILIGLGSACSSKASGNRVLEAIGAGKDEIESNIRLSLGIKNTLEEAKRVCEQIKFAINKLENKNVTNNHI